MTQDEIIRMAREANIKQAIETPHLLMVHELERFAALVAAAEREACAKVLFDYAERDDLSDSDESLLKHLFELIRARG
jgi:hypothetical protein